jgi:hypothetical protein
MVLTDNSSSGALVETNNSAVLRIIAYPAATPQCWEALEAATSKRDRPIMATAGPMVSGVIHLSSRLNRPILIFKGTQE